MLLLIFFAASHRRFHTLSPLRFRRFPLSDAIFRHAATDFCRCHYYFAAAALIFFSCFHRHPMPCRGLSRQVFDELFFAMLMPPLRFRLRFRHMPMALR